MQGTHRTGTHRRHACREGWHALLASTLEHSRTCAQLRGLTPAALICALELSVVGRHLPPSFRLSLAQEALTAFTAPAAAGSDADATAQQGGSGLHFKVQWDNMSSGTQAETGGSSVLHHSWLNVVNLSVACVETGSAQGDVVLAVALRNMLPEASALGMDGVKLELPVAGVHITAASDKGYTTMEAHALDARRGWVACLGDGGLGDGKGGPGETIGGPGAWRQSSQGGDDLPQVTAAPAEGAVDMLHAGEWTIYAARLQAGSAAHVNMHAVQVSLSKATSVTFMVGQLGDAAPRGSRDGGAAATAAASGGSDATGRPEGPPHIICGASALGLQNGLVGRDAPFDTEPVPSQPSDASGAFRAPAASAALKPTPVVPAQQAGPPPLHLRAGVYGVALRQRSPPAALLATRLPASLRIGELAVAEIRVSPHRTVSAGTPLWLRVREDVTGADAADVASLPGAADSMQEIALTADGAAAPANAADAAAASLARVFVGYDAESACEVAGSREIPLPALAVGAPCVLTVWVVGVGVGRVAIEGGMHWPGSEADQEPAVRSTLQVTEPLGLQASFSALGGRVIGMRAPEQDDSSTSTGASRVAAGALAHDWHASGSPWQQRRVCRCCM